MLTPGAVTSGLSQLSPVRGPPEVKLAGARKPGLVDGGRRQAVVDPVGGRAAPRPSTDGTPRNGMVTVYCSPVSGLPVIGPSNGGKRVGVVHHQDRGRAGLLAEDGAGDAGARAAPGDDELAGDVGGDVLVRVAAERDLATGSCRTSIGRGRAGSAAPLATMAVMSSVGGGRAEVEDGAGEAGRRVAGGDADHAWCRRPASR